MVITSTRNDGHAPLDASEIKNLSSRKKKVPVWLSRVAHIMRSILTYILNDKHWFHIMRKIFVSDRQLPVSHIDTPVKKYDLRILSFRFSEEDKFLFQIHFLVTTLRFGCKLQNRDLWRVYIHINIYTFFSWIHLNGLLTMVCHNETSTLTFLTAIVFTWP